MQKHQISGVSCATQARTAVVGAVAGIVPVCARFGTSATLILIATALPPRPRPPRSRSATATSIRSPARPSVSARRSTPPAAR